MAEVNESSPPPRLLSSCSNTETSSQVAETTQLSRAQRRAQERKQRKLGKNIVESKQKAIDDRLVNNEDNDDDDDDNGNKKSEDNSRLTTQQMNIKGTGMRIGARKDPPELVCGFVCISYTAPSGTRQRSREVNVKIRSPVFEYEYGNSEDEKRAYKTAKQYSQKIHSADPDFDVFVVEAGGWITIPPPMKLLMQVPMRYDNDEQQKTMKAYYRGIEREHKIVQQRVKNAKAEAAERVRKYHEEKGTQPIEDRKPRPEYNYSDRDPNAQPTLDVPFRESLADEQKRKAEEAAAAQKAEEERKAILETCAPYDLWGATMRNRTENEGDKEWWE